MRTYIHFLFIALFLLFSVSCIGNGKKEGGREAAGQPQAVADEGFPYPAIPAMLTSPAERKAFLLAHYWDEFDFADTALVDNREVAEQGLVNQLALLVAPDATPGEIAGSLDNLCSGMEQHAYARRAFMQLLDDYLYNPNSPFYHEPLYAAYLRRMLRSTALDAAAKSTLAFRLELIGRNNTGSRATDFAYYLSGGQRRTLHGTQVAGGHLLLFFYDPECDTCREAMGRMVADTALASAVARGELTVLAVYTEDNEAVWRKARASLPAGWLAGHDRQEVKGRALYDLKAMPSLYLLDKDKRVVLKDAAYDEVRRALGF